MNNKKIVVITICLFCMLVGFSSCDSKNNTDESPMQETKIFEDIEFVKSKFPKIEGIESVKYVYEKIGRGGVGLQTIQFNGIIQIDDTFAEEIFNNYEWENQEIYLPIFLGDNKHKVLYCDDFDEEIHTSSFVGEFYFDKINRALIFIGEY